MPAPLRLPLLAAALRFALPCGVRFALPFGVLASAAATAQPPNDFFYYPIAVVQGAPATGTNVGATSGGFPTLVAEPVPTCLPAGASAINSVWWWFVPSAFGTITVDLQGSGFNTILGVHRLDGALSEVVCNDDFNPPSQTSRVQFGAQAGVRYFVRVAGVNGAAGAIALSVTPGTLLATPPGDVAFNALLMPTDGVYPGAITGATNEPTLNPPASCVGAGDDGGNSVWRMIDLAANGTVTIDLAGSDFNTILTVLRIDGGGSSLTEVACNNDFGPPNQTSRVSVALLASADYLVRVTGFQGAAGATLRYTVTGVAPPPVAGEPGPAGTPTALLAPAPNPTAGAATLRVALAEAGEVDLAVYDLLGRRVATLASGVFPAGSTEATWDTSGVPAGVYVARLRAGGRVFTQRLTVAR